MTAGPDRPLLRFIFNPRSGYNQRRPGLLQRTQAFIAAHQLSATIALTESPRHATALAREAAAEGCDLVVAVGGDGTINEVADGLTATGATLGLIPCGSGNGLARHLGLYAPGIDPFVTLLQGRPRAIDTGTVNGRPFFNAMGFGFDAEIAQRFNHLTQRGLPAYVATVLRAWRSYQAQPCHILYAGGEITRSVFLVAVANSAQYGNNCYIAPRAEVDDGRLDLTLVPAVNFVRALSLAVRLRRRTLDQAAGVMVRQSAAFTIVRAAPGPVHTDGEVHELDARLEVRVRPGSLRVQVPARRA